MKEIKKNSRKMVSNSYRTMRLDAASQRLVSNLIHKVIQKVNTMENNKTTETNQHITIDFKKIRVLMITPIEDDSHWRTHQIIADQLKLLVHEVIAIKAYPLCLADLPEIMPDVLLFIGNDFNLSQDEISIIKQAHLKKAIWLSDGDGSSEILKKTASVFDYVFTQDVSHIPYYQFASDVQHIVHLPYTADSHVYYPKLVDETYKSNLLIIGDADPLHKELITTILELMDEKKIYVLGNGWDSMEHIIRLPSNANLSSYYNGTEMIVNWSPNRQQMFECAACGAFQLIQSHPSIYGFMRPGEDIIVFHTAAELLEKMIYYLDQVDQKRAISTKALQGSIYRYSYLQMTYKLLHIIHTT